MLKKKKIPSGGGVFGTVARVKVDDLLLCKNTLGNVKVVFLSLALLFFYMYDVNMVITQLFYSGF
uniref:Uncharacterized protein n=1 Tax=Rhizophora mucronata TaxID=61149 RepID=A0A2P2ILJ0_RHIMU